MWGKDREGAKLCTALSQKMNGVESLESESQCSITAAARRVRSWLSGRLWGCLSRYYDFTHKIHNDGFRTHLMLKIIQFDLALRALKARAKNGLPSHITLGAKVGLKCPPKCSILDVLNIILYAENIWAFEWYRGKNVHRTKACSWVLSTIKLQYVDLTRSVQRGSE